MKSKIACIDAAQWLTSQKVQRLTLAARGLYAELCVRLSACPEFGRMDRQISIETLAFLCGADVTVIEPLMHDLIDHELIAIGDNGELYSPEMLARAERSRICRANGMRGGNPALAFKLVNQEDKQNNKSATKPRKRKEYLPEFAKFWSLYPHPANPGSKLVASTAFSRLDDAAQSDAVLGIDRLKAYAAQNSWYHTPMAMTYLNQRRWEAINIPESAPSLQSPMLAKYGRAAINGGQK